MKFKGFTLVEMLVVIAIIGFLAAMLIVVVGGGLVKQEVKTTLTRIDVIMEGLDRFKDDFPLRKNATGGFSGRGYPRPDEFADLTIDGVAVPNMTGGEFLRLMLHPTQDEIDNHLSKHGITKKTLSYEEIKAAINEDREVNDPATARVISASRCFVDSWNQPLYYRFPGRNHSGVGATPRKDLDIDGNEGIDNNSIGKPDIWSTGQDRTTDETIWNTKNNDPLGDENDDVVNWFVYAQFK